MENNNRTSQAKPPWKQSKLVSDKNSSRRRKFWKKLENKNNLHKIYGQKKLSTIKRKLLASQKCETIHRKLCKIWQKYTRQTFANVMNIKTR